MSLIKPIIDIVACVSHVLTTKLSGYNLKAHNTNKAVILHSQSRQARSFHMHLLPIHDHKNNTIGRWASRTIPKDGLSLSLIGYTAAKRLDQHLRHAVGKWQVRIRKSNWEAAALS